MYTTIPELIELANLATDHLIRQEPLKIIHAPGWQRNGLPLPIKRMAPDEDGTTTQFYRPLGILEYVNEMLIEASSDSK